MATQEEVQALADRVNAVDQGLEAAKTQIETEFAALEKQISEGATPSTADLTPLGEAISKLEGVATGVETIQANPPAAAPAAASPTSGTHEEQQAADTTGQAPVNKDGTAQTA